MSTVDIKYLTDKDGNKISPVVSGSSVYDILGKDMSYRGYRTNLWTNSSFATNTEFSPQTVTVNIDNSKYSYYLLSYILYNYGGGMFKKDEIIIPGYAYEIGGVYKFESGAAKLWTVLRRINVSYTSTSLSIQFEDAYGLASGDTNTQLNNRWCYPYYIDGIRL